MSSLQGLGQPVSESYLAFQVLDLSLWVVDILTRTRKLLRGHPLAPGGGDVQQLLTQAGQLVLQVDDHGVFVLGFELKIRQTGDFFAQQQNQFILRGGGGVTGGGPGGEVKPTQTHTGGEWCHSFWQVRAGGGGQGTGAGAGVGVAGGGRRSSLSLSLGKPHGDKSLVKRISLCPDS